MARTWSTKTLARELIRFIKLESSRLDIESSIGDLIEVLKSRIVADEVGEDLSL